MFTELITWIRVADLDRSLQFYERALGLRRVLHQGDCAILEVTNTACLGLCSRPEPRDTPGLLLCFVTPDVVGTTDALVASGATLEQAPRENPTYAIEHAFLLDPDGHRIEVQRFLDPEWRSDPGL